MAGRSTGRRDDAEFMGRLLGKARERSWSLVRLARESGISLPTLSRWRRRLEGGVEPRFVEMVARSSASSSSADSAAGIEVVLRDGHRVLVGKEASGEPARGAPVDRAAAARVQRGAAALEPRVHDTVALRRDVRCELGNLGRLRAQTVSP